MGFLTDRRRRRTLAREPLPDSLWEPVVRRRPVFDGLTPDELGALRDLATLFVREKHFSAPGFAPVDESVQVEIAALAALPILHLGLSWYDNWRSVVVVPRSFTGRTVAERPGGVVEEWEEADVGESWENGPVVVSLRDVVASRRGDGENVVIHEAAHRLDMTDGEVNGRPALHRGMDSSRWFEVCGGAYHDFRSRVGRRRSRIDPYAAEDDAEFFAVMTEYFFERPGVVRAEYPELYDLFVTFYRQDPAARIGRGPRRRR